MPYVVTEPKVIARVYATWDECKAALASVSGPHRQMKVETAEEGEAILAGGIALAPGWYAFTDGNAIGGVGVVIVRVGEGDETDVDPLSTSVIEILKGQGIEGYESDELVKLAVAARRNVVSEMVALYAALDRLPSTKEVAIVHDYLGVAAFMNGEWKADSYIRPIVEACRELAKSKSIKLNFRHQRSHRSSWAGRNDYAAYNAEADRLASGLRPSTSG